jgi:uncharacterized alpha-E superfamily protein
VLSRIAESLYWMGRYLERADDTARILDVHLHRSLAESVDHEGGVRALAAMGLDAGAVLPEEDGGGPVDLWRATEVLAYDVTNPSSVAGSLELARDNARGLRETLAAEVWEAINRTHHELEGQVLAARSMGPHLFFRWVRDRVAQVGGLFDSVVLHDDGWRFFTIGRCLERVDMTSRLLGGVASSTAPGQWAGVLISCGAYDAFLRTHGGDISRSRALGLVLQSPDLPRSVVFALTEAEACLRQVARADSTTDPAERELGRMRSELVYAGADELTPTCEPVLERLQETCRRADEMIRARYFRRADLIEWHPEAAP